MPTTITLTAADGHTFAAYVAEPPGPAYGGVVVIQEIFGVNSHIRSVADDFAREGFLAVAPALFDRVQPGLELGYGPDDMARGMRLATKIGLDAALLDVAAALKYLRGQGSQQARPSSAATPAPDYMKAAVVGYCFGGTLAWLAATRLDPAVAVCYYGGRISQHAAKPRDAR